MSNLISACEEFLKDLRLALRPIKRDKEQWVFREIKVARPLWYIDGVTLQKVSLHCYTIVG